MKGLFRNKFIIVFLLLVIFLSLHDNLDAAVEYEYPLNLTVSVDGREEVNVRAITYYYPGNVYVSMRDMASSLSGTEKAFDVGVNDNGITIKTGIDYIAVGGENEPFVNEINEKDFSYKIALSRNKMLVNDKERKYYTIVIPNSAGYRDAFISITDFAMIFDMDVNLDGNKITINTKENLKINLEELKEQGFFIMVNSAIAGDVTTGEVFFDYKGNEAVPIASTTKLMTYVVAMDAVRNGTIDKDIQIVCSSNVERLANTSDGIIKLKEGDTVNLEEALIGMLLPSSNEMALAIAENVAGSEEEFVKLMNNKAKALGMSDSACFYNCNGLPSYSNKTINAKRQNMLTAQDMFILVEYIANTYPEIEGITSLDSYRIAPLMLTVNNTNPLLFNLDGVSGLKTGTTTRAGMCLVTMAKVEKEDGTHRLMVAEFGAESSYIRGMVSELLLRYSMDKASELSISPSNKDIDVSTPEKLIQFLLK